MVTRARRSNESLAVANRGAAEKRFRKPREFVFREADDGTSRRKKEFPSGRWGRIGVSHRARGRCAARDAASGIGDDDGARRARREPRAFRALDAFVVGREGNAIEPECGAAGFGTSRVVFGRGTELVRDTEGVPTRETLGR